MPEVCIRIVIIAVIAYFCGCFNGSVIVSKYILRDDVRNHGSGNAGLTNFYRTFGGPLTFVVILTDVLKAVVAVWVGILVAKSYAPAFWDGSLVPLGKYWAGLFCLLGHMFPCMFGFRGGKGIMSGGIIAIMISWKVAVVVWGSFLILTAITKYVSVGSISTGFLFPIMAWLLYRDPVCLIFATAVGGLIVFQHRGNIARLAHGEEHKFSFSKKSK